METLEEASKNIIEMLNNSSVGEHISPKEEQVAPEEAQVLDNKKILRNYISIVNL